MGAEVGGSLEQGVKEQDLRVLPTTHFLVLEIL